MAELFTFEVVVIFLFLRTDVRTNGRTNEPDNYNDQDTVQTVSIWLKNLLWKNGPLKIVHLLSPINALYSTNASFNKTTFYRGQGNICARRNIAKLIVFFSFPTNFTTIFLWQLTMVYRYTLHIAKVSIWLRHSMFFYVWNFVEFVQIMGKLGALLWKIIRIGNNWLVILEGNSGNFGNMLHL